MARERQPGHRDGQPATKLTDPAPGESQPYARVAESMARDDQPGTMNGKKVILIGSPLGVDYISTWRGCKCG